MFPERFIAGEDIEAGDVCKWDDRVGVIRASSGVIPGDFISCPRVVSAPRSPASPYNAKPVPRFEVGKLTTEFWTDAGFYPVSLFVYDKLIETRPCYRTWFRRNQERAILALQKRMAEEYGMSSRLSGSVETLTGVKLV